MTNKAILSKVKTRDGRFFVLAALIVFSFVGAGNASAENPETATGFIVRGNIAAYARMGSADSKTARKITEAEFTAIVNTKSNTYSISVSQQPTIINASPFHGLLKVGSDGIDHYVLKQVISTNHEVLATSGEVGKGLFPHRCDEFQQVVWLLCVLDHLPQKGESTLIQESRQLKFFSNNNFPFEIFEVETRPFSNDINSIQSIRYYHPGYELGPDGKKIRYEPPNDKGYLTASFEKGEVVFHELGLPREAVFTTYLQTHYITNRDDVPPFSWDELSVTSCERYYGTGYLLPEIITGTHIDDYRLSENLQGRPIGYECENNRWKLMNDEKLQVLFREYGKPISTTPNTNRLSRNWVLAALVLLTFLPLLYISAKTLRERFYKRHDLTGKE